ncbi:hypothetical protein, partial [Pseudomonas carnis]|uniref:hypothetical protein n=1 Tax=Pseudomonas carnis TaxID=2487355 RepID=UPI001F4505E5
PHPIDILMITSLNGRPGVFLSKKDCAVSRSRQKAPGTESRAANGWRNPKYIQFGMSCNAIPQRNYNMARSQRDRKNQTLDSTIRLHHAAVMRC